MGPGPELASTLLAAHRTRSAGVVMAERWTLHLQRDRVIGVEGVPELLADLRRPSSGDLVADLERFTRAGVPLRRVTDAAWMAPAWIASMVISMARRGTTQGAEPRKNTEETNSRHCEMA